MQVDQQIRTDSIVASHQIDYSMLPVDEPAFISKEKVADMILELKNSLKEL